MSNDVGTLTDAQKAITIDDMMAALAEVARASEGASTGLVTSQTTSTTGDVEDVSSSIETPPRPPETITTSDAVTHAQAVDEAAKLAERDRLNAIDAEAKRMCDERRAAARQDGEEHQPAEAAVPVVCRDEYPAPNPGPEPEPAPKPKKKRKPSKKQQRRAASRNRMLSKRHCRIDFMLNGPDPEKSIDWVVAGQLMYGRFSFVEANKQALYAMTRFSVRSIVERTPFGKEKIKASLARLEKQERIRLLPRKKGDRYTTVLIGVEPHGKHGGVLFAPVLSVNAMIDVCNKKLSEAFEQDDKTGARKAIDAYFMWTQMSPNPKDRAMGHREKARLEALFRLTQDQA